MTTFNGTIFTSVDTSPLVGKLGLRCGNAMLGYDQGYLDGTSDGQVTGVKMGLQVGRNEASLELPDHISQAESDGFVQGYGSAVMKRVGYQTGYDDGSADGTITGQMRGQGIALMNEQSLEDALQNGFNEGFLMGFAAAPSGAGPSGGGGSLVVTQNPTARMEAININVVLQAGANLYILMMVGNNIDCIYTPDGFVGMFLERSTVVINGVNVKLSILPNGGWWTKNFSLILVGGKEIL